MHHHEVFDVGVERLQNVAELEASWKELEARAAHPFYLSWLWIGTWLRHLPKDAQPHVLTARRAGTTVGLAVVCRRRAWSFGPRARARWFLNESGDARFDRLFIEHNKILAERSSADAITVACLKALMHRLHRSDQLVLSGIDPHLEATASRIASQLGLIVDVKQANTAWRIDLSKVREKGGNYRAALGRHTRQAVSRSIRLYAERGPVEFRVTETPSQALAAFDLLANFHQARWGHRGSFTHPSFRRFHEELIARGVHAGAVRISRTLVGERTIGVLYNFVHDGWVLNYQSGFLYENDGRLKPGFVSHVLSTEDSILRGERGYDFLAGSAQHKPRLANAEYVLKWITVGGDGPERRVEAKIRSAKVVLRTLAANLRRAWLDLQPGRPYPLPFAQGVVFVPGKRRKQITDNSA
jgi:CelD/BcsL family acetyltransferase involved in cellulose biosynthesis